jgi:hypothetical protein
MFERDCLSLWCKLRIPNIFTDGGIGHRLFPKRAHKIVMNGIKSHPFHVEKEDNCLLAHRKTEAKRTAQTSFSQEKQELRRTRISFRLFISSNNHPLPLP